MRWVSTAVVNFVVGLLCVSLLFNDPKEAYRSFFSPGNLHGNVVTIIYFFGLVAGDEESFTLF